MFYPIITTLDRINKNVTDTKRDTRGVTPDLGGGQGRKKQKRYIRGVTTDLLDV